MKDQSNLNYRVIGNGYPVVLLHGFLESNSMWESITPHLSDLKLILVELPGHGKSTLPKETDSLTIEKMAQEIWKVIKKLEINQFSVIGHSLGGYVALQMKKDDDSDLVEKIILLNSHPWEDSAIKKAERTQVARIVQKNKSLFLKEAIPNLFRKPENHKQEIKKLIDEALEMDENAISETLKAMRDRQNYLKVLKNLGNNCLVIQGKHDHLIPYEKIEKLTKENGNQYYLVKSAGHMAYVESKEEVLSEIKRFIQPERNKYGDSAH